MYPGGAEDTDFAEPYLKYSGTIGPATLLAGIAYVDTDISKRESAYLQPNFSSTKNGSSIASGLAVFSATASF